MNRTSPSAVLLLVFLQAPLVGEWRGELRLPDRNGVPGNLTQYRFTLKVDGTKVSGTINNGTRDYEIGDGEIVGDKVRFAQMQLNPRGGISRTFVFEGLLNGDELILTRTNPGGPTTNTDGTPLQPPQPITFKVSRLK